MKMKRLLALPFLTLGFLAGCGEGAQTSQENQSNTAKKRNYVIGPNRERKLKKKTQPTIKLIQLM